MEFENNALFWQKIDTLYLSGDLEIHRPKGSTHPVYSNLVYPVDYGYITDVTVDERICVYKGTSQTNQIGAMVVCIDILKKDIEVKFLLSCTEEETLEILRFVNQTDFQKSIIVSRGDNLPSWATKD